MCRKKTIDGIRLEDVVQRAQDRFGAGVRSGKRHAHLLTYQGVKPCPVATSTHARRMVAPWLAKISDYTPDEAYRILKGSYDKVA